MSTQFPAEFLVRCKGEQVSRLPFDPVSRTWTDGATTLTRRKKQFHLMTDAGELPCRLEGDLMQCGDGGDVTIDSAKVKKRVSTRRPPPKIKGPGTCLAERIEKFVRVKVPGAKCGCAKLAAQMDRWRPDGCEQHREEIVTAMVGNADLLADAIASANVPGCGTLSKVIGTPLAKPILTLGANWLLSQAIADSRRNIEAAREQIEREKLPRHRRRRAARVAVPVDTWPRPPREPQPLQLVRNLAVHVFPVAGKWEWLIDALRPHLEQFNGRRLVSVMTAPMDRVRFGGQLLELTPALEVREAFKSLGCEVTVRQNVPKAGEFVSFAPLVEQLQTDDPRHVTLYLHSKGSKHNDREFDRIMHWNRAMLDTLVDTAEVDAEFGLGADLVGALGGDVFGTGAVPMGSFYWFRNSAVPPVEPHRNAFYTSESWPAEVPNHSYLLGTLPGNKPFKQLYSGSFWQRGQGHALLAQKKARQVELIAEPTVSLITPTGDRPQAFELCERWIRQQTFGGPIQWIVVDDGQAPTETTAGQTVVRRPPGDGHTLPQNLAAALPHVTGDFVIMIEDDDYYPPQYLELMVQQLQAAELVGERGARYYYLPTATHRHYLEHTHSSLCRTGFRRELVPLVQQCCEGNQSIDLRLWEQFNGTVRQWASSTVGCIGIKGMPGRKSHNAVRPETPDGGLATLKRWCPDWKAYLPFLPPDATGRGTLFSLILNEYDEPRPVTVDPKFEAVLLADRPTAVEGWQVRNVKKSNSRKESRRLKLLACERFPDAEWILYHDGQLQLKCSPSEWFEHCRSFGEADLYLYHHHQRHCVYHEAREVMRIRRDRAVNVQPQLNRYKREGVPAGGGLYLGGIHIRKNTQTVREFERLWWREVQSGSVRDQISLPVALARSGVTFIALPPMDWSQHFQRYSHQTGEPIREAMSKLDREAWEQYQRTL